MNTETRAGYKSTELWLVIAANLLVNVGAIDVGDSKLRGILAIASVIGYTLSRGLAKQGVPNVDPLAEGVVGRSEGVKAEGFEPGA